METASNAHYQTVSKIAKKEKDQDDTEDLKRTKFRGSVQRHRLSD